MPCKVLIVDDQMITRQLFEHIVRSSPEFSLAAAIETAKIADAYCAKGGVDLILMDVVMRDGSNGLDAAARIKASYPHVKIIITTSMPDALFLKRARDIGADSFWYKEVQSTPLLEVMRRTMAGESVWPEQPPTAMLGLARSTDLTERELEVLRPLAEGQTDKEIADLLHMSVPTVRYHVTNLISKTGFSSRTELAVNAVRSGITVPKP